MFCLFIFTGCSYFYPEFVDTRVSSIYITITYDNENLKDMGVTSVSDINLIKQKIEQQGEQYSYQLSLKYKNIINNLYLNEILSNEDKVLYKNHLELYSGWSDSTYIIELKFLSMLSSRIFIRNAGFTEGSIVKNNLFTTHVEEEYEGLFNELPNNSVTTSVNNYFSDGISEVITSNWGAEVEELFDGVEVNYMFLTKNSRMNSNGVVISTSNGSIHYFIDSDEGNNFIFHIVEANRYVWYLLGLTVTMIFLSSYLMIIYFKKTKVGKNSLEDIIKK